MIDETVFKENLDLLCFHFQKQLHPKVVKIWKQYLDIFLTNELLELAVKTVIIYNKSFPTASELKEAVAEEIIANSVKQDEVLRLQKTLDSTFKQSGSDALD